MKKMPNGGKGAMALVLLAAMALVLSAVWFRHMETVHDRYWQLMDAGEYDGALETLTDLRRTTRYSTYDLRRYCEARACSEEQRWEQAKLKLHEVDFPLESEERQQELEAFRQTVLEEARLAEARRLEAARKEQQLEDYFREEEPAPSPPRPHWNTEEEDPYDANDYYSEEDFYDYWSEDFADFYDAADYYEEHHHDEKTA